MTRLLEVESKVKDAIFTELSPGLVRKDGKIYYPNEVFLVDSFKDTNDKVKKIIEQMQNEVGNDNNSHPELVKIRENTKQLELKIEMIKLLERFDASREDIIGTLAAV